DSNIIKEYNPIVFGQYLSKEVNQHSVGMVYVKLDLAVNDSEMKDEYVQWNKYINLIGNKEKAIEQGYFWAVKEAKLIEISAVLAGSNELTPTLDNKIKELLTLEKEKKAIEQMDKKEIDYAYLVKNFLQK
ncbi:MAG TPA: hypothetical protein VJ184_00580, partial [Chryseolinea sp.]|nr:hypothetical protein [Chryseolinea sp.]